MNIFLLKGITYSQCKIKYSIRWKILKKFAPFFRNWLPIYFGANIYLFKVVWANERKIVTWSDVYCLIVIIALPWSVTEVNLMVCDLLFQSSSQSLTFPCSCLFLAQLIELVKIRNKFDMTSVYDLFGLVLFFYSWTYLVLSFVFQLMLEFFWL